jgi:hypothetical protein
MKLTARIIFLALVSLMAGLQLPALVQADTLSVSKSGSDNGNLRRSFSSFAIDWNIKYTKHDA